MTRRELPSDEVKPISFRIDPTPKPVARQSISHEAGQISVPLAVASGLVVASLGLAACQPVKGETPTPGGVPTSTPAAEVTPMNPPSTEVVPVATETPVPDFSKPSIFQGLFLGQYKIDGVLHSEGTAPGYDTEVNTYYREGSDLPVGFGMTDSYLMTYYSATTDKSGVTSGRTPDGRVILKKGNVWVLENGDTFVPYVASLAGKPFGDPVFTADDKLAIVDGTTGAIIPGGEPRDPYQKPADIAKYYGFTGDISQVTGVDVNPNGNLVVFGKDNKILANLAFFAKAELLLEQQPVAQLVARNFAAVATAAGFAITPEQLLTQGFQVKTITGVDGKTYEVATAHLDPNPNKQGEAFEGDYPLMIKNEQGEWKMLSLTKAFEIKGKEVQVRGEPGGGVQVPALVNFGGVSVTTTLEGTVGYVDANGWNVPDGFAEMTDHPIIGQIAWGFEPILPQDIKNLPADQLQAFAVSEINEVINHFLQKYPNKRFDFIVAGESTQQTLYHKKLGDPNVYLIEQYKAADKAITDAGRTRAQDGGTNGDKLAYSDFISGVNDPNLANIIGIAKTLKSQDLLDVVYLQLRYVGSPNINPSQPPTREQLSALSERIFNESGVHVIFSEVGIKGNGDPRTIFENTVGGCMDSSACLGVQFYAVGQAEDGDNQFPIFDTKGGKDVPNLLYYDIMRLVLES